VSLETGLGGRRALVTGAASGIGRAAAVALAAEGARVLATDRDAAGLGRLAAEAPVETAVADLADPAAPAELVVRAGTVDVLVCVAGVGFAATAAATTLEQWDLTFAVNARAPFLLCRAAIPGMVQRGGGVIVNVTSALALAAAPQRAAYTASKAAVIGLTRSIAVDHAADGVRANCIAPGTVDSPWVGRILAGADDADGRREQMAARQLTGRMGTVEEIADAIVFLASDRATFMHGSVVVVDGGLTAR
jgi:2-keto-3-deoxy-L-fuconate dehydrogenase